MAYINNSKAKIKESDNSLISKDLIDNIRKLPSNGVWWNRSNYRAFIKVASQMAQRGLDENFIFEILRDCYIAVANMANALEEEKNKNRMLKIQKDDLLKAWDAINAIDEKLVSIRKMSFWQRLKFLFNKGVV